MSAVRVRYELKDYNPHASPSEREIAFKKLLVGFRRACLDAQILHDYKRKEYYESPGEKKRRKKRESENERLKAKLNANFPEKKKPKNNNSEI